MENYSLTNIDPPVEAAIRAASDTFSDLGAEIVNIEVPPLEGQLDYAALFRALLHKSA